MSAFLRKALSTITVAATTLYTVGLTAFVPVASAQVASGTLIKASLKAVYYMGADGKRYVFPNEKTYFTWYSDFSTVVTITDAELAAIPIGGNVTYRPGVKMIKIDTDPKVYAVSHNGGLHWITSEAIAVSLYGSAWASLVEDLSDAFFVNYTVGAQINNASEYDKAAELAASPTINADKGLTTGGTTPAPISITASLASDNPAGATVPKASTGISVLKFNLSGSGTVTNLTFKDMGIGASADIAAAYLYEGSTRLTSAKTFNTTTKEASFNLNLAVSGTRTLSLVIDIAAAGTATAFGQHQFALTQINGANVSGVVGSTFTVGTEAVSTVTIDKTTTPSNPTVGATQAELANFKLTGGTNDSLVNQVTFTQTGSIDNTDLTNFVLKQGSTTVATASAMSGDKIVLVFNPSFSLLSGAVKNFTLYGDVAGRPGRTITLYVDEASDVKATDVKYGYPAAITNNFGAGASVTLTTQGGDLTVAFNGPVTGDISIGSQDVSLFEFTLTASSPMTIRNAYVTINGTTGSQDVEDGSGVQAFSDIKIVNKATGQVVAGPVSYDVAANANTSGQLTLTDDFDISGTTRFAITADVANDTDFNGVAYQLVFGHVANGVIFTGNADVKYQESNDFVAATDIIPNTPITGNTQTARAASLKVGLSSSINSSTVVKGITGAQSVGFTITAGADSAIKVSKFVVDPRADLDQDGTYSEADAAHADETAEHANKLISTASLWKKNVDGTLTLLSGPKGVDGTIGNETITFENFTDTVAAGQSALYIVSVDITTTAAVANADNLAIDIKSADNITAEDADNNSVTATTSTGAAIVSINDNNNDATFAPQVVTTINSVGTLTVTVDADTPKSMLIATGSTVAETKIKFSATNEAFVIDKIRVKNDTTTDEDDDVYSAVVMEYKNEAGATVTSTSSFVGDYADFTALEVYVAADSSSVITLKGVLNTAAGGADNDDDTILGADFSAATGDFRAIGKSSSTAVEETGATVAITVSEPVDAVDDQILDDEDGISIHYVFESYPTVAFTADTPAGNLVPSGNSLVAKINVTAGANADITFTGPNAGATNLINFNVDGSGAVGAADMWLTDGSTELCREAVNFSAAADTFTCDFQDGAANDTNLSVAAGTTKTLYVYYDTLTAALTTAGDSIQLSLLDDAAANIDWSIDTDGGNYQHADILFRGDKFGGALIKP